MKKVRLGIFGLNRGGYYIPHFLANDADIVAICDKNEKWQKCAKDKLDKDVACYDNFDEFINHPMDAVFIANYFHEHTSYAIRCLEKNIHVLSECTSNGTMAEGVALVRAAEKSNAIYMLAENYPYMTFNREMKKICDGGTLGQILYAEGEYNHPGNAHSGENVPVLFDSEKHWRCYLPKTYYITHSLAPIMYATGASPKKVTAFPVSIPAEPDICRANYAGGDNSALIMTHNDDGSVFRVTACSTFGAHHNAYRICGKNGSVENVRGGEGKVMLRYNGWTTPEGAETDNYYLPGINDKDEELIKKAGHDGGDFFVAREFLNAVRENKPHPFDVYFATTMASVAILAHRGILEGGKTYDIPDFRKEEDRVKYENDTVTPFWGSDGSAPTIPCCSNPGYRPSDVQISNFRNALKKNNVADVIYNRKKVRYENKLF